jgi:hypothetical protein
VTVSIDARIISEAARSFPVSTSCIDGIPIKLIAALSHELITAMAAPLKIPIIAGGMPTDRQQMTARLIDQKKGSYRPIILCRTVYRLLGRIASQVTRAWERVAVCNMPFDNNVGRLPLDATNRAWLRQATGTIQGKHAVDLLIDLRKCFEHIDGTYCGRLSTGWGIRWTLQGFPSTPVLPTGELWAPTTGSHNIAGTVFMASRGIAGGSPFATTELKVYLVVVLQAIKQSSCLPSQPGQPSQAAVTHTHTLSARVFVDDVAISCTRGSELEVANLVLSTFGTLKGALTKVGLPIAEDKTELIATSELITKAFASYVKLPHNLPTCRKLGVDVTYAKLKHEQCPKLHVGMSG